MTTPVPIEYRHQGSVLPICRGFWPSSEELHSHSCWRSLLLADVDSHCQVPYNLIRFVFNGQICPLDDLESSPSQNIGAAVDHWQLSLFLINDDHGFQCSIRSAMRSLSFCGLPSWILPAFLASGFVGMLRISRIC